VRGTGSIVGAMKTTERKVYFGCRLDSDLINQVRRRAKYNRRTIGGELARILKFALPVMHEADKRMAEEQAFFMRNRAAMIEWRKEDVKKKKVLGAPCAKNSSKEKPK
jgi:hypothetical protein